MLTVTLMVDNMFYTSIHYQTPSWSVHATAYTNSNLPQWVLLCAHKHVYDKAFALANLCYMQNHTVQRC